jgi:hypothetical protein
MKPWLLIGLALFSSALMQASKADDTTSGHYSFVGPLSSFMPSDALPGAVTTGLPFSIVLSPDGKMTSDGTVQFKIAGTKGTVVLHISEIAYSGGSLTGKAKLENTSGTVIEGLRLDFTDASDSYKAKSASGDAASKIRTEVLTPDSPLVFGDITGPGGLGPGTNQPQRLEYHIRNDQPVNPRSAFRIGVCLRRVDH